MWYSGTRGARSCKEQFSRVLTFVTSRPHVILEPCYIRTVPMTIVAEHTYYLEEGSLNCVCNTSTRVTHKKRSYAVYPNCLQEDSNSGSKSVD